MADNRNQQVHEIWSKTQRKTLFHDFHQTNFLLELSGARWLLKNTEAAMDDSDVERSERSTFEFQVLELA
jgi:hypothetical protein